MAISKSSPKSKIPKNKQLEEIKKTKQQILRANKNINFINDSFRLLKTLTDKNSHIPEKDFKKFIQNYKKKYVSSYSSCWTYYNAKFSFKEFILNGQPKLLNYCYLFSENASSKDIARSLDDDLLKLINKNIISCFSERVKIAYINKFPKEWLNNFSTKSDLQFFIKKFNFHTKDQFVCEFLNDAFKNKDFSKELMKKDFHSFYKDYIIENNIISLDMVLNFNSLSKDNIQKIIRTATNKIDAKNIEILFDYRIIKNLSELDKEKIKNEKNYIINYLNSLNNLNNNAFYDKNKNIIFNLLKLYNKNDSADFLDSLTSNTLSLISKTLVSEFNFPNKKIVNKLFDNEKEDLKLENTNHLIWMLRTEKNSAEINKKAIELVLRGKHLGIIDFINPQKVKNKKLILDFIKLYTEHKISGFVEIDKLCKKHKFEIKVDVV